MTVLEFGAAGIAVFATCYYLGIFRTFTAILGLVAVVCLGLGGWIGRVLTDVAGWVVHMTSSVTSDVIGATFAGVGAIVIGLIFAYDLHPRNQTRSRTAWLGIALGVLIVTGLTGIPALDGARADITSAVGNALHAL